MVTACQKQILLILGVLVLLSYYLVFGRMYPSDRSYVDHEFWFGIDAKIVRILIIFQIMAVVGFLIGVVPMVQNNPTRGILKDNLFTILCLFFVGSIIWPYATFYKKPYVVVISLVVVAISSILLLAGSIEDAKPRWNTVLGTLLLAIVTVLIDGVLWNANYIMSQTPLS